MNRPLPNTPPMTFSPRLADWVLAQRPLPQVYESHFHASATRRDAIPAAILDSQRPLWVEIGAGTGGFFEAMARREANTDFVAIERDRMRGKRLQRRTQEAGLKNFLGIRGNAIPTLISGIPTDRVDKIFILYPCPCYKINQAKNRWHFHPIMKHLHRVLKPGGQLIWASDQKFYIDEAHYVSAKTTDFEVLNHSLVSPNQWNGLEFFPEGRSKFEQEFLAAGLSCYELVLRKRGTTA